MSSKVFGYRREVRSFSIHSPIRYYFGQMDRTQCIQSGSVFIAYGKTFLVIQTNLEIKIK